MLLLWLTHLCVLLSLTAYCHHLIIVILYVYSTCFLIRLSDIMHYVITFYKLYRY
jgi:hypothetical protein